mmetsp:Transcript_37305/g.83511  ORF Transcript_37305/g.83511 Transcript_37305/m.83511 type:complete len:260 (+) Transcript_37305:386-1165(+)
MSTGTGFLRSSVTRPWLPVSRKATSPGSESMAIFGSRFQPVGGSQTTNARLEAMPPSRWTLAQPCLGSTSTLNLWSRWPMRHVASSLRFPELAPSNESGMARPLESTARRGGRTEGRKPVAHPSSPTRLQWAVRLQSPPKLGTPAARRLASPAASSCLSAPNMFPPWNCPLLSIANARSSTLRRRCPRTAPLRLWSFQPSCQGFIPGHPPPSCLPVTGSYTRDWSFPLRASGFHCIMSCAGIHLSFRQRTFASSPCVFW